MKLVYKKNGIKLTSTTSSKSMYPLADLLTQSSFAQTIKTEINSDIKNNKYYAYTFSIAGIKTLNKDNFLLFNPYYDKEKYNLIVPQEAFWNLLDEYDKVVDTNWKKMIITFDGKEFNLKLEY